MAYPATVFNIMIASPGDVKEERLIAREVIREWNAAHSDSKGIILRPLEWDTDARPELGDRPQGIINKQLVDRSDLLVAIFWTRLGSPTGKAISGTVEEINEHIQSGKPVMLYFSSKPSDPTKIETGQLEALNGFRDEIKQRGLCKTFKDEADFRSKFALDLAAKVNTFRQFGSQLAAARVSQTMETEPNVSELSKEAKELLLAASAEHSGFISTFPVQGGRSVIAFGAQYGIRMEFAQFGNEQSQSILDELETRGLIEPLNQKKSEYKITAKGIKIAALRA